ncbi:MAG: N-acetylmuramidase domain-containing protein [Alphaproteobacteria bacterium]|nr:N-acetylmuramidase domain-containing protein [Alphaproteobacteria bacterium]
MARTAGSSTALEFAGKAKLLKKRDFDRAAERIGCEVAAIRAVADVESGGRSGFLRDARPKILFESRWFHKLTDRACDDSHPHISTPKWVRNYRGGAEEYDRLHEAIALDREAAPKSASWGKFQILGVNHRTCGFETAEEYVQGQRDSEGAHLGAFVGFVIANRLDDELRDKRWADSAAGYNGPGYRQNRSDQKMADAYAKYAAGGIVPTTAEVQQALNRAGADLVVDGKTGPKTRAGLRAFQRDAGLPITGLAEKETLAALGLAETHDPIALSAAINS